MHPFFTSFTSVNGALENKSRIEVVWREIQNTASTALNIIFKMTWIGLLYFMSRDGNISTFLRNHLRDERKSVLQHERFPCVNYSTCQNLPHPWTNNKWTFAILPNWCSKYNLSIRTANLSLPVIQLECYEILFNVCSSICHRYCLLNSGNYEYSLSVCKHHF